MLRWLLWTDGMRRGVGVEALETLPQRLVCVGGSYISFAFAHVAVRVGAQ